MLEAGEAPLYVAIRITRFTSEGVGLAAPYALEIAVCRLRVLLQHKVSPNNQCVTRNQAMCSFTLSNLYINSSSVML